MFYLSIMYGKSTVCAMRGAKVQLFIEIATPSRPIKWLKQAKKQTFKII